MHLAIPGSANNASRTLASRVTGLTATWSPEARALPTSNCREFRGWQACDKVNYRAFACVVLPSVLATIRLPARSATGLETSRSGIPSVRRTADLGKHWEVRGGTPGKDLERARPQSWTEQHAIQSEPRQPGRVSESETPARLDEGVSVPPEVARQELAVLWEVGVAGDQHRVLGVGQQLRDRDVLGFAVGGDLGQMPRREVPDQPANPVTDPHVSRGADLEPSRLRADGVDVERADRSLQHRVRTRRP